jgi:hypothetical protein
VEICSSCLGLVRDEGLFHGLPLLWRLVDKLWLVYLLFSHNFLFLKFFFFFFLNVVSGLLSYGPLNLCIKWKDNWILGTKPLHESNEKSAGTAASVLLFGRSLELRTIVGRCALDHWAIVRTRSVIDRRHKTRLLQLNENKTKIKLNNKIYIYIN